MLYVVGHKNPDTDSYCAAVACSAFLNATGREATPIVLDEPNGETRYVFEYLGIEFPEIVTSLPEGTDVVLVDHNELGQSIDGRNSMNIVAVYDHHKVGDFVTSGPLTMRLDPVGCTCTILHEEFTTHGRIPPKEIALLMCAAIISDTLLYKSPTTTKRDRDALEELTVIAGISNLEEFAINMFNAKSDLTGMSGEDIVTMDYKMLDYNGTTVAMGVIETTNPLFAMDRKEEILDAITMIKERDGLEYLLLFVVDILEEKNIGIIASEKEKELVSGAFGVTVIDNCADLGNRVSRKKQMVPDVAERFNNK